MTNERREQDRGLVERAQQGDREAYGALVRQHQRRVFVTALQLVRNEADAEDLTQEVFVKAYRALGRFDQRSDLFTWLYRITVNTALTFLARSKRRRADSLDAEDSLAAHVVDRLVSGRADPQARLEARQLYRLVSTALDELKPELQTALVLHVVQGMSHQEVATVMQCPEGTVSWRVSEARRLLRVKLRRRLKRGLMEDELSERAESPRGLP